MKYPGQCSGLDQGANVEAKRSALILDISESTDWTVCELEADKAIQAHDKKEIK